MQFSHLHNHTQYSLLDGATNIKKLYKKAAKDKMPAVAITDHGNMFGVFDFVAQAWNNTHVVGTDENGKEIKEPVVKPIVGCEFYVVENRHKRQFSKEDKDKRYHQLFLAKDEIGYQNLTKLCSLGFIEGLYGKYPRIDKELILQYHEGLIATTCCLGAMVPQTFEKHGEEAAEKEFKWWLDVFGEDYYIELQNHGIPEQEKLNDFLLRMSKKHQVHAIASNDSHYLDREDYNAHDILLCINTGEKQATPTNKEFSDDNEAKPKNTRFAFYNDEFFFKSTDEMSVLFKDNLEVIENTQRIVDKVKPLKLEKDILLPHFIVPEGFQNDQDAYLYHLTWEGARERYAEITPDIEERINFELFTIKTMGFAGYFLIVSDFIKAGRDLGVFVGPGRGSAAGSAVAYCIGITNIDPIKYNLLFERFLNPDRKSMPDIDTDFDDEGRQKVIDYVVKKYGYNQVAHIVTYGTMAAKMSIKDVARVLDLPLAQSNALAKLVPDKPGISLNRVLTAPIYDNTDSEKSLKNSEELRDEDLQNVEQLRKFLEVDCEEARVLTEAMKLEGSVRNTGIHAAGIIIAPKDLSEILPVCTNKDTQLLITQYEGKIIENAGVIKMDFLGLKTLTILKDALKLIERNHGIQIDLDNIPLDDRLTYELFQRGETNGVFQFESPGMQKHMKDLKPDKLDDLIAMNALYRPGPLQYIPNFIKRKHGEEEITYDLPEMEQYLSETYGITVYQEQVMLLSQKIGNFSKGDADVLRKAMGKKQISVLQKMKEQFMRGAQENGHPPKVLEKIWTDWEAFAQYAFNKSHSTCYAFVAFQTAYLKAHYPGEFMAAVLNNTNSTEKITFFMEECHRMGLQVLGPDVNESIKSFSVNKSGVIRFGLNAIKGAGEASVSYLVEEREANGLYTDIFDFVVRNTGQMNKKTLEVLVKGGALDTFSAYHRGQLLQELKDGGPYQTVLEMLLKYGQMHREANQNVGNSLFGDVEMPEISTPNIPNTEQWPLHKVLNDEKEVLGFYMSAHPLDEYKFEIDNYGVIPISQLSERVDTRVRIAGFVSEAYKGLSKKGDPFGRFVLNDFNSSYVINLWQQNFIKFSDYLIDNTKILIEGTYKKHRFREGEFDLEIHKILPLSTVPETLTQSVTFEINMHSLSEYDTAILNDIFELCQGRTAYKVFVNDYESGNRLLLESENKLAGIELNQKCRELIGQLKDVKYKLEIEK